MNTTARAVLCGVIAFTPQIAQPQGRIPVVNLPPTSARTAATFGAILGLHQAADGKVLVNDALRRRMTLFDSTLATSIIVMDSAPGSARSYGRQPTPLIAFIGDSSLFADWNSRTVIVLDGHGHAVRSLALPQPEHMVALTASLSGVDGKGRLVYQGWRAGIGSLTPSGPVPAMEFGDSLTIVRADLESRRIDTIARIARPLMKLITQKASDGAITTIYTLDPLQAVDEWAVLSTGAVALVRGHDYRIDWVQPDGSTNSTAKLPFEWRRLTDEDKHTLNDSLRAAQAALLDQGYPAAERTTRAPVPCNGGRGPGAAPSDGGRGTGRSGGDGTPPPPDARCTERLQSIVPMVGEPMLVRPPMPPLADLHRAGPIPDYAPPIRVRATTPDLDGNLWILPRVSALSTKGELVYDVVNGKGELFERVRLPFGRAIAGFGKGGIVYMTSGDLASGFFLERTTLPRRSADPK